MAKVTALEPSSACVSFLATLVVKKAAAAAASTVRDSTPHPLPPVVCLGRCFWPVGCCSHTLNPLSLLYVYLAYAQLLQ